MKGDSLSSRRMYVTGRLINRLSISDVIRKRAPASVEHTQNYTLRVSRISPPPSETFHVPCA